MIGDHERDAAGKCDGVYTVDGIASFYAFEEQAGCLTS